MVYVEKNNIIISRKTWESLKRDKEYKELITTIEETAELEKAKRETKYFIKLEDYIKQREKKEKAKKTHSKRKRVSANHK